MREGDIGGQRIMTGEAVGRYIEATTRPVPSLPWDLYTRTKGLVEEVQYPVCHSHSFFLYFKTISYVNIK